MITESLTQVVVDYKQLDFDQLLAPQMAFVWDEAEETGDDSAFDGRPVELPEAVTESEEYF